MLIVPDAPPTGGLTLPPAPPPPVPPEVGPELYPPPPPPPALATGEPVIELVTPFPP